MQRGKRRASQAENQSAIRGMVLEALREADEAGLRRDYDRMLMILGTLQSWCRISIRSDRRQQAINRFTGTESRHGGRIGGAS